MIWLPWKILNLIDTMYNIFFYHKFRILNFIYRYFTNKSSFDNIISVHCGFQGKTGGTYAIANIINLLSRKYTVKFVTSPTSNYNPLLNKRVTTVKKIDLKADIFLCDVSTDINLLRDLSKTGKLIITCHGLLDTSHGLTSNRVMEALLLATKVHFVGQIQQDSFKLPVEHFMIIPNTNPKINKTALTSNIGIIGNINNPLKNIKEAIELAGKSDANEIHIWGSPNVKNDCKATSIKVIFHNWCDNKSKIYNSFDILISLSKKETFGMVVTEAMSAGIPCILSDIPAFREFKDCPGIKIVDHKSDDDTVSCLNHLLKEKNTLSEKIIAYWQKNYSEEVIYEKWSRFIDSL
jgi:glycosyltransferase involved in cell wall biosynthesis